MALRLKQLPAAIPGGLATLDASGRHPLAQDAIRAWQVVRAARSAIVSAGGTWSGLLASTNAGNPDATDGSWEAVQGGTPAPAGGVLSGLISAYLTGVLGMTSAQATTAMQQIWTAAASVAP